MRIILAGASGTIGTATAHALLARGWEVLCPVGPGRSPALPGTVPLRCDLTRPGSLRAALTGQRADAVISCMASRTGAPRDAWAVDHDAQLRLLEETGDAPFILLSAICVQKPELVFQHAKLAFEATLRASGRRYSIVRPTAYFKSLSGQVARVRDGKPFLVFGDGRRTACKPISDRDLAGYLIRCLEEPALQGRVLPIGGPGPAITPMDQAEHLFGLLGQAPRVRHVPLALMDAVVGGLDLLGRLSPTMRDRAEFARTGRYYARESMLVWDGTRYDPDATPETGQDTLWEHYAHLIAGRAQTDLGAHGVF